MPFSQPEPEPAGTRTRSVRGQLILFSAALVGPILLLLALILWFFASNERNRLEREALQTAQEVANLVDRDFAGLFASLDTLATSPYLRTSDFEGFHRQASELIGRQGIVPILNDLEGQLIVNVRVPWGTPLPKTGLPFSPEEVGSGRPFVTNLFEGRVSARYLYSPATGLLRDGKPASVLSFAIEPERLRRILVEAGLQPGMTAVVVDRKDRIIARSRDHERFVAQPASPDFLANTGGPEGTWSGASLDGEPIFAAYSRSRLSGYRIGVTLPYNDLQAPLLRSLALFAAIGAVTAGLSTVLGLYFAHYITVPISALAGRAGALGRGEPVEALGSGLKEADEVGAELAAASASLRAREAELRDANDEIQRFAYIVSHDLRSPLVNIMGFTAELEALQGDAFRRIEDLREKAGEGQNAHDDGRLGQDFGEATGFIKASIEKMDRLINAILKLSREGRREFKPERIDMNALFAGIKASAAAQALTADAAVEIAALPPVVSDRLALEQVFSNLIDNALKYLRRGIPGTIVVRGYESGSGLVYEVRDNGRGIDPKDRDRVFELFRRAGAQDKPGEGIGLAHVRALLRRLGGTISLTSEPGQGSVFVVTLPRHWPGKAQKEAA